MSKYFGTDGFRGEANVTLTVDHAFQVGRFLGWYYSRDHKGQIVIGKDTRRSSYMFECALAAGITASGADACLMHVTTTPSVSYISKVDEFDCGIMISASHNPFHDNGIKLINRQGEKMEQERHRQDRGLPRRSKPKSLPLCRYRRGHWPHGHRLCLRPEPLHRLPHQPGHPLLQGREGGPGLRQRQRLDDRRERL